jgi:nickel transport protein
MQLGSTHRPLNGWIPAGLLASTLVVLSGSPVRAHGIESSVTRLEALSSQLMLQSQFSNGEPTSDAVVRLVAPDGKALELGRTDAQGKLSFALPNQASGDWELQVDGGPGHRDYLEMPVQGGQAQLDQISAQHRPSHPLAWLSAAGATAMLLGLQRIRRPR